MRPRGLLIAVIVLAALGGAVWWSNKTKKAEEGKTPSDAPPKILSIPEDQFAGIEIRKKDAEPVILKKGSDAKWQMVAPKPLSADQDAVNALVTSLASLSSDRLIEEKAADLNAYGLAVPSLEVVITKRDGKTQKLLIGDDTPTGGGSFAHLDGDGRVYTIATYSKTSLDKNSNDLRDKRLLTFDSERLVRLEVNAKKQVVEFGKNAQSEWQIVKPRPLRADGWQIEELIRKLKDARMDTSVSAEDAKKAVSAFASGAPAGVARVTDAAGTQQLELRKDKDNNYYAKSSVVEGIYKITSELGAGLDKSLDDLRNKKLFDFGFNDPTRIEIHDGAKNAVYLKAGDKWMTGSQQVDGVTVQNLIDKLRDLVSIKFVDAGFTTPMFEAVVMAKEGKLVDKVQISKAGNNYYARRENEPAVYELDGKVVEELRKTAGDVKPFTPSKKR
jgi:hypothetical protein